MTARVKERRVGEEGKCENGRVRGKEELKSS
jgi:hypothetical protein